MTLEELTPSDEDKPYVTESEESEDTEEDVTDKEMRSNLKRKKFCKKSKKLTQQNPQPHQNPQLTKTPLKQKPPMTKLLPLHNKKLHNVCYLNQVRFLTFINLLSLFFQNSPVNTARKYTEADSLF